MAARESLSRVRPHGADLGDELDEIEGLEEKEQATGRRNRGWSGLRQAWIRVGRRRLTMIMVPGAALSLAALGVLFATGHSGRNSTPFIIACLMVFMFFTIINAVGPGPTMGCTRCSTWPPSSSSGAACRN